MKNNTLGLANFHGLGSQRCSSGNTARERPLPGGSAWKVDGAVLGSLCYTHGHLLPTAAQGLPGHPAPPGRGPGKNRPKGLQLTGAPLAGNKRDAVIPPVNQCQVNHRCTLCPLRTDLNCDEVPRLPEKPIKVIHPAPLTPYIGHVRRL